jgi:Alpha-L-arabinofuranosidase B (ABFB) domain
VVHAASGGGVTLESARFPGYFLVGHDFSVRLEKSNGSAFNPVAAGNGTVHLRSASQTDRYLVSFRSRLYLAPVPASRAAEFAPS